jgi:hypothetical protein
MPCNSLPRQCFTTKPHQHMEFLSSKLY